MTAYEKKALFRFQIIHPLLDDRLDKGELTMRVKEASAKQYVIPGSRKTTVSESTIWSWYKTYLRTRSITSLVPQNRKDKGKKRKITKETADSLLQLRLDNPRIPLTALVKKAEAKGLFTAGDTLRMSKHLHILQGTCAGTRSEGRQGYAPVRGRGGHGPLALRLHVWPEGHVQGQEDNGQAVLSHR